MVKLCYESPCGVMRILASLTYLSNRWLRIPMRGYEEYDISKWKVSKPVTNPHAGL